MPKHVSGTKKTKPIPTPLEPEKLSIVLDGTSYNDVLVGTRGDDTISGGEGNDLLSARGTLGSSDGHDKLYGGLGDDTLYGSTGNDLLDGGEGRDTVTFDPDFLVVETKSGAVVDLSITTAQNTRYGSKTFVSIENLVGTSKADRFHGNEAANELTGGEGRDVLTGQGGDDLLDGGIGNDRLSGGEGNDTLIGGTGKDVLTGGDGEDVFVFNLKQNKGGLKQKKGDADTVTDFTVGIDKFKLMSPMANAIAENGALSEKAFHIGPRAENKDTRIIYNDDNGILYYDADGSGNIAAIQIAKIGKGLALTSADFII